MEVPSAIKIAASDLDIDLTQGSFAMQISLASTASRGTTIYSLEEHSDFEFPVKCGSKTDAVALRLVDQGKIKEAIRQEAANSNFGVTIADPNDPDMRMMGVSEEFASMTGYRRTEILGKNCRFLNSGCDNDPESLMRIRAACMTGEECVAVLTNRRKTGELFLNLLRIRGLTVAKNPITGEQLWFLVALHADVTDISELDGAEDKHIAEMQRTACLIRKKLANRLAALPVSDSRNADVGVFSNRYKGTWCLLPTPKWRGAEDWLPRSSILMSGLASSN